MKKLVAIFLAIFCLTVVFTGCSTEKKYIGTWDGYKFYNAEIGTAIVFKDLEPYGKMEMMINIYEDGSYAMHFFVNGEEGNGFPRIGRYKKDGKKLVFDENFAYAEIVDGELIIDIDNGALKYYCEKKK